MKPSAAILRALPLDARGRRAVEEVLADWRHESALAPTPILRAAVTARAGVALIVAMTMVTLRDVGHAAADGLMRSSAAWLLLFTIAWWLLLTAYPPAFVERLPAGVWTDIKPGWVAVWAGWSVPLAFFGALVFARSRDRREPRLIGVAIWAFAATVLVDGWLVPWFDAQTPMFFGSGSEPEFRGLTRMGNPTLPAAFSQPHWNVLLPLYQVNEVVARATAAAALVLLASQLWPARPWLRAVTGVVAMAAIYTIGFTAADRFVAFLPSVFYERLTRAWIVPSAVAILAVGLGITRRRLTRARPQLAM
jgi:hypothetical protein